MRLAVAAACVALCGAPVAGAASLADVLRDPRFARLGLAPLGPALADTVAATYPVASASASVVYAFVPAFDTPERRPGGLGPILGERAETIGEGRVDLQLTYSYVDLATIGGESIDDLVNDRLVNGRLVFFPVPGGVTLRDGRIATILPVRVAVDLDVEAHVVAPSVTYGVTPDLDVNLVLPVLRTALDVTARTQVPDPRWPAFALPPGDPRAGRRTLSASAASEGLGDVLLRATYVLRRGAPANVAAGLALALPTGSRDDFHGTGTTRVQPALIASRVLGRHLELLANAGIELDGADVDRSVVRWAAGGVVTPVDDVGVPIVFLGRHELAAPAERIRVPFFFQVERGDYFDAAVGIRWRVAARAVASANALVPLNRDGLRADVIPTVQLEWVF